MDNCALNIIKLKMLPADGHPVAILQAHHLLYLARDISTVLVPDVNHRYHRYYLTLQHIEVPHGAQQHQWDSIAGRETESEFSVGKSYEAVGTLRKNLHGTLCVGGVLGEGLL